MGLLGLAERSLGGPMRLDSGSSMWGVLPEYAGRNPCFRLLNSVTFAYDLRFSRSLYPCVGEIMLYNLHLGPVGLF